MAGFQPPINGRIWALTEDFEPLGRQRAELVDGQSAVSLLRRLVERVADAGTYSGGRRLLDAQSAS